MDSNFALSFLRFISNIVYHNSWASVPFWVFPKSLRNALGMSAPLPSLWYWLH